MLNTNHYRAYGLEPCLLSDDMAPRAVYGLQAAWLKSGVDG